MTSIETAAFKTSVEEMAQTELTRLEADRELVEAQLEELDSNIRTVKSVLKATQNGKPGPTKGKKKQSPFSMSAERTEIVVAWLQTLDPETEISNKLLRSTHPEWSDSFCNGALKVLREQGYLRLAATTGQALIYRRLA